MLKQALSRRWPLILVLSAPTGSGKTLIFMVLTVAYILAKLLNTTRSPVEKPLALLIYPRKALATDQLKKFVQLLYNVNLFLKQEGLEDIVIDIGVLDGDSYDTVDEIEGGAASLRGIDGLTVGPGNNKLRCIYDLDAKRTRCYVDNEPLEYRLVTDIRCELLEQPPAILITNVWMLEYYIVRPSYVSKSLRQRCSSAKSALSDILFNAPLLVLDEAHAYRDFQQIALASLIHRYIVELALRRGYAKVEAIDEPASLQNMLRELVVSEDIGIVLSSATITTVDEGCKGKQKEFSEHIKSFVKFTLSPGIYEVFNGDTSLLALNYDCLEKGSKDTRLSLILLLAPRPRVAASSLQQEVLLALLTWASAFKRKTGIPMKFISFFENKDEIHRVYDWVVNIIVKDRCEHCDHMGMPDYIAPQGGCGTKPTRTAKEAWQTYIN